MIPNTDITGVFDSSFNQLFPEARAMKAFINREAKIMQHPLEDGATIVDHRIILPTQIEMLIYIPTTETASLKNVYQRVLAQFLKPETLIVQTKVGSVRDMIISSMPHEENSDMIDCVAVSLRMEEAQFVKTQFQALPPAAVRNKGNTSTTNRGEQQSRGSIAYRNIFG